MPSTLTSEPTPAPARERVGRPVGIGAPDRPRRLVRWLPGLLVVGLGSVLLLAWGVAPAELLRFSVYWVLFLAVPGVVAWRVLGPRLSHGIEDVAVGVCVGYAAETLGRLGASVSGLPTLIGDVLPLTLTLIGLGVPRVRKRVSRPWRPLPRAMAWSYAALLGLVFVWFGFGCFARQPLSWSGHGGPENDLLFALALAGEATHRWPLEFPWVQGEPLLYHWFFAEPLASARELSGVQLPVLVLRVELLPAAALVVLTTGAIATRLAKRSWCGPVAAFLVLAVQDAAPISWSTLAAHPTADLTGVPYDVSFWWSTSSAFAAVVFAPAAVLLVDVVRGQVRAGSWALLVPLLVVGVGAKASIIPVVLAGASWVVLSTWWVARRLHRQALVVVLVSGVLFLAGWLTIYGTQPQGLEFYPLRHVLTTALGSMVLGQGVPGRTPLLALAALLLCVLAALAPLGGLALLVRRRATRTDPASQLCVGVLVLGVAGMVLLYHQGQSNLYLLRTGMPLLAAGAAWGVAATDVPRGTVRRSVTPAACAFAAGVVGMGVLSIRDWTVFAPEQAAASRLGQVAVAWAILLLLGAVVAVGATTLGGASGAGSWLGRPSRVAVGLLAVAFFAGCGAVRVPGQALVWSASHPMGWVDASANPWQQIDADGVRAATWIRDHSAVDDVVLTNVLCSNGSTRVVGVCDNRTFWVTAYSERRTLVSGWGYTATANALATKAGIANAWQLPFWDQPRLDRVRDFLAEPTKSSARGLADDGVRWVLTVPGYDEVGPQMAHVAVPEFRAGDVVVYRLPS